MTEPELLFRWRVLVLCQQHVQVIGECQSGNGHWQPWVKNLVEVPECMTIEFSDGTILEIGELTSVSSGAHTMQQPVNLIHSGPGFKSLVESPYESKSEHGDSGGWYHSYLTYELTVEGLGIGLDSITWDIPQ